MNWFRLDGLPLWFCRAFNERHGSKGWTPRRTVNVMRPAFPTKARPEHRITHRMIGAK